MVYNLLALGDESSIVSHCTLPPAAINRTQGDPMRDLPPSAAPAHIYTGAPRGTSYAYSMEPPRTPPGGGGGSSSDTFDRLGTLAEPVPGDAHLQEWEPMELHTICIVA